MEDTKQKKPPRRKQRNPRALHAQRDRKTKSSTSSREQKRNRELFGMLRVALLLLVGAALLLVLVLSMRPSVQYLNAPEIQRIRRVGVLKVGVLGDAPGFSDGEQGLEIALARALAQRIFPELDPDAAMELVSVNAHTALPKLNQETVDIVFAKQWASNPDSYAYSYPYFSDAIRLLCLPGRENAPLSQGQVVGVISGSSAARAWETYTLETELGLKSEEYVAYEDLCLALQNGAVQYMALPASHIRLVESWGFALHRQALGSAQYVAVAGLGNAALTSLTDLVIEELQRTGELDALVRQYDLAQYRVG